MRPNGRHRKKTLQGGSLAPVAAASAALRQGIEAVRPGRALAAARFTKSLAPQGDAKALTDIRPISRLQDRLSRFLLPCKYSIDGRPSGADRLAMLVHGERRVSVGILV